MKKEQSTIPFWKEIKGFPVESVYLSLAGLVLQAYQAYLAFPALVEEGWGKRDGELLLPIGSATLINNNYC